MPESPELDQVARKIAEAKELAREVELPHDEMTGTVENTSTDEGSDREEAGEDVTRS